MHIALGIMLAIFTVIMVVFVFGSIGEQNKEDRHNYLLAACLFGVICFATLFLGVRVWN